MSLLPFLLDELQAPRHHNYHHYNLAGPYQNFLTPRDILLLQGAPLRSHALQQKNRSSLRNDSNEFKVNLDVQQFKPEEVSVKLVDNFIVVEGKHEERQDEHGYVQRQFQRRYLVPEDVDANAIQSHLSSDGVLTVSAPKKAIQQAGERQITIVHTNKPAISQENTPATQEGEGDKK